MDRNVSNDMTGTSIMLPLATIEEDIDESLENNINKVIDKEDGKSMF